MKKRCVYEYKYEFNLPKMRELATECYSKMDECGRSQFHSIYGPIFNPKSMPKYLLDEFLELFGNRFLGKGWDSKPKTARQKFIESMEDL